VLESNGVVTCVDATIQVIIGPPIFEAEKVIVRQYEQSKLQSSKKTMNKIFGMTDVEIVGVEDNQSIRLYFLCATLRSLQALRHTFNFGRLKHKIDLIIFYLLTNIKSIRIRVKFVSLVDYCKSEDYFLNDASCTVLTQLSPHLQGRRQPLPHLRDRRSSVTSIDNMPLVVTEQLLLKAFVFINLTSNKAELLQKQDAYQTLSAVQNYWRITFAKLLIVARQLRSEGSVSHIVSYSGRIPIE